MIEIFGLISQNDLITTALKVIMPGLSIILSLHLSNVPFHSLIVTLKSLHLNIL